MEATKACSNGMAKERFSMKKLMQLQEITQETMSRLRWHHFTMGSVRVVPYKDVTRGEVATKCHLPPTELN